MRKIILTLKMFVTFCFVFSLNAFAGTLAQDMADKPDGLAETYWETSGNDYLYFAADGSATYCFSGKLVKGRLEKNKEVVKVTDLELFKGQKFTVNAKIHTTPISGSKVVVMGGFTKNETKNGGFPFRAIHNPKESAKKSENCFKTVQSSSASHK